MYPSYILPTGSMVYEKLGYKAFGIPGKLAASISITMQNFGGKRTTCPGFINQTAFVMCILLILFQKQLGLIS